MRTLSRGLRWPQRKGCTEGRDGCCTGGRDGCCKRIEIAGIASFLLSNFSPAATNDTQTAAKSNSKITTSTTEPEIATPTYNQPDKGNKDKATNANPTTGTDATNQQDKTATSTNNITITEAAREIANLPTISNTLLRFIGAHKCLCKACAHEYHEELEDEMSLDAAAIYKASLSREARQAVKQKYLEEYRVQMMTEASQEVIQEEKAKIEGGGASRM